MAKYFGGAKIAGVVFQNSTYNQYTTTYDEFYIDENGIPETSMKIYPFSDAMKPEEYVGDYGSAAWKDYTTEAPYVKKAFISNLGDGRKFMYARLDINETDFILFPYIVKDENYEVTPRQIYITMYNQTYPEGLTSDEISEVNYDDFLVFEDGHTSYSSLRDAYISGKDSADNAEIVNYSTLSDVPNDTFFYVLIQSKGYNVRKYSDLNYYVLRKNFYMCLYSPAFRSYSSYYANSIVEDNDTLRVVAEGTGMEGGELAISAGSPILKYIPAKYYTGRVIKEEKVFDYPVYQTALVGLKYFEERNDNTDSTLNDIGKIIASCMTDEKMDGSGSASAGGDAAYEGEQIPDDDYDASSESGGSTGGDGEKNFTSDSLENYNPGDYEESPNATYFTHLYFPTADELNSLKDWLSGDVITSLAQYFTDPLDGIIDCYILPIPRETLLDGCLKADIGMAGLNSEVTSYEYPHTKSSIKILDCGTLTIPKGGFFYGSYLDGAKHSSCSIYLPFIGTMPLSVPDVLATERAVSLNLSYAFDILTGNCVAFLRGSSGTTKEKSNETLLYQFAGSCKYSIPVTSKSSKAQFDALTSVVRGLGTFAVGSASDNPFTMISGGIEAVKGATNFEYPAMRQASGLSGTSGLMCSRTPALYFSVPKAAKSSIFQQTQGYTASMGVEKIGDLKGTGYTEFSSVKLSTTATKEEADEIKTLLKGGVWL